MHRFRPQVLLPLPHVPLFAWPLLLAAASCGGELDSPEQRAPDLGSHAAALTEQDFDFGQFRLHVSNLDPALSDGIILDLVNTHFILYPWLRERYNPNAPTLVHFIFTPDHPNPASAFGDTVTYDSDHLIHNPLDWDIVTHEIMHVIQYPHYNPGWLIEGIADYVRDLYGVNNQASGWRLTDDPSKYYNGGYGHTALFLIWVEENRLPTIVDELMAALVSGSYSAQTWTELTGQSVEQLWNAYRPSFPLPTDEVTLFADIEYGGSLVQLAPGRYTLAQLLAAGIPNDWLSSIWIPDGFRVQVFSDDGFAGRSWMLEQDTSNFLDIGANDEASSIFVERL
jgi:basic secretory peptidase family protein